MPRYRGAATYLFEVVLMVFWSHFVWHSFGALFMLVASGVSGALSGDNAWLSFDRMLVILDPRRWLLIAHLAVFTFYPVYLFPRFPFAPRLLTFAIAFFVSVAVVAAQWSMRSGQWSLDAFVSSIGFVGGLTAVWSVLSALIYKVGGPARVLDGVGRLLGWLFVGRAAYEAFRGQESARLQREYEAFVNSFKRSAAGGGDG